MQVLMEKVEREWDKYDNLPSRLREDPRRRHAKIYARAMDLARNKGWNPEPGEGD